MKFCICAGHSNSDPGAVSSYKESELVTELRNIVALKLRDRGHEVLTDGSGSDNKPLSTAISLVKAEKATAVELHFNASANSFAKGVETISLSKDKITSQRISQNIASVLGTSTRGDKGWKTQEESARGKLGFVQAGGMIVEVCFLSNPTELQKYLATKWLVAEAIVRGLLNEDSQ